jgi:hypothetical protein
LLSRADVAEGKSGRKLKEEVDYEEDEEGDGVAVSD